MVNNKMEFKDQKFSRNKAENKRENWMWLIKARSTTLQETIQRGNMTYISFTSKQNH